MHAVSCSVMCVIWLLAWLCVCADCRPPSTSFTIMEVSQALDRLSNKLDALQKDDLIQLLESLESISIKTRNMLKNKETTTAPPQPSQQPDPSSPPPSPHAPPPSTYSPPPPVLHPQSPSQPTTGQFQHLFRYVPQPLDDQLVARVHKHIKGLQYHPNPSSPNSPEIYLYGEQPYIYNKQSSEVSPKATLTALPMAELLIAVNRELNTSYNSMLINKYRNIHCKLGPHKDDEENLDPSSPISALSLGAIRRLQVSLNSDKDKPVHTVNLSSGSICTMLPGFQDNFFHSIAAGRKSFPKEKGARYSITFRRILSNKSAEEEKDKEEKSESASAEKKLDENTPDTLVFGSSLTKDLDSTLLSKYDKNFRVFSNSGAKVNDIANDVKRVKDDDTIDLQNITTVFFICGGNDIENLKKHTDIVNVYRDYENLISVAKDIFPFAKMNIISLIPRRARYREHINNMHVMNEWLESFCCEHSCRFVNVFSHFLVKLPHIWLLNNNLFNPRRLHFNRVGYSVLAKVLIGVANSPR